MSVIVLEWLMQMNDKRLQKSMVSCLQSRYEDQHIYTYIGNVLIAINPFQTVNIYDDQAC